jgi:hypothetical protein
MTDELVKRLRECSPYGLGLIDVQREEAADSIEAQAALIEELVAALERICALGLSREAAGLARAALAKAVQS